VTVCADGPEIVADPVTGQIIYAGGVRRDRAPSAGRCASRRSAGRYATRCETGA